MPQPRTLDLTPASRAELERLRSRAPQPYLRERAAALLLIAAGHSVRQVARTGLYQVRRPETVSAWLDRYLAEGPVGLRQAPRRHAGLPP